MDRDLTGLKIPQHIAIIMDGNGRWAKSKNHERFYGHQKGVESVRRISKIASEVGVKYLTLYAFSKENWSRPKEEVDSLMGLLIKGVNENLDEINGMNIKLNILGDKKTLPTDVKEAIEIAENSTSKNTGMILIIALNYGSRWEIINATKLIAEKVKNKDLKVDEITEELFAQHLLTRDIPDPDLMIRTSGEYRISNFLLWQISYSELYITDVHWPDFDEEQFIKSLQCYSSRERRFGKISDQLK